jgi:hypothetical protein
MSQLLELRNHTQHVLVSLSLLDGLSLVCGNELHRVIVNRADYFYICSLCFRFKIDVSNMSFIRCMTDTRVPSEIEAWVVEFTMILGEKYQENK